MNKKQKKFVLEKLIPFILREQGNGFAMDKWRTLYHASDHFFDGVLHSPPSCGTVCCIGGSIEVLLKLPYHEVVNELRLGNEIGLSGRRADVLFYGWDGTWWDGTWPEPYRSNYKKANTPLKKAKVAVALLKAGVKTNWGILGPEE